jgi:hypothetical protein
MLKSLALGAIAVSLGEAGVVVLHTAPRYRRQPKLRPFIHVGSSLENMRRHLVAQWQTKQADGLRSAMVEVGGWR